MKKNLVTLKTLLVTIFWKQNNFHAHGVLIHTLRVTWEIIKTRHWKMIPAGLLHDVGKPIAAHQKPEDVINNEYSFTDHEDRSFQIIKNWPFVSEYTKNLVRYHYLIRRMSKAKKKEISEYDSLRKTYDSFTPEFKKDLSIFLRCDDLGKGKADQ